VATSNPVIAGIGILGLRAVPAAEPTLLSQGHRKEAMTRDGDLTATATQRRNPHDGAVAERSQRIGRKDAVAALSGSPGFHHYTCDDQPRRCQRGGGQERPGFTEEVPPAAAHLYLRQACLTFNQRDSQLSRFVYGNRFHAADVTSKSPSGGMSWLRRPGHFTSVLPARLRL